MRTQFLNRIDAGRKLAEFFFDLRDRDDVIVLGLPRGGVPVAAEVARAINASLDVLLVRKIGAPSQPELAIGAIASGGDIVLDQALINQFDISPDAVQGVIDRANGKFVLLIDDGLATGSTMRVAIQAVKRMNPAMTAVGVPVGAAETVAAISAEVDRVECVDSPKNFMAVGRWDKDFRPVTDDEVIRLLG